MSTRSRQPDTTENRSKSDGPNMPKVLVIGFDPAELDFDSPELAPLGLTEEKIMAGVESQFAELRELGFDPSGCFVDLGDTAEQVLRDRLDGDRFDCIVIGAGIRNDPVRFALFERLLNVVHRSAPSTPIAFNTSPIDTAAAVRRWLDPPAPTI